jgi:hypothetical protein
MFLQSIESLLDRRMAYLAPRKGKLQFTPPDRAERVGWYDPDDQEAIWIDAQVALHCVIRFYREGGLNFDVSRDALKRIMLQSDVLRAVDAKGDNAEVSKYMGDSGTKRSLEIDLAKVEAAWEIDLRYPRELHDPDEPDEPEVLF